MRTGCPIIAVFTLLSIAAFASSATAFTKHKHKEEENKGPYVANFIYTPVTSAAPASSDVTFAVDSVTFQSNKDVLWPAFPQFSNLGKAVNEDLTRLLTAKGFHIRGPFDSYDLVPYSDKKTIDLWLTPNLELLVTLKDKKEKLESIWAAPPVYILSGTADVRGKIVVELREIATKELMWSKKIPITFSFPYSVRVPRFIPGLYTDEKSKYGDKYGKPTPFDYGLIMDDIAKQVEEKYPELMATLFKLMDPEEMAVIKKQCQELKSKKGY